MSGKTVICSILINNSPGKEKYFISLIDKLYDRRKNPKMIPKQFGKNYNGTYLGFKAHTINEMVLKYTIWLNICRYMISVINKVIVQPDHCDHSLQTLLCAQWHSHIGTAQIFFLCGYFCNNYRICKNSVWSLPDTNAATVKSKKTLWWRNVLIMSLLTEPILTLAPHNRFCISVCNQ